MAELGFIGFVVLVFAIGLLVLIIYAFKKIYGDRSEPRNEDLTVNLLNDYTKGYGLLVNKETEGNKQLIKIKGSPRDIDYIKLKDQDFKIEDQDLFVKKNLYIPLGNSAHRKIYLALPDKPEHLSEEIKGHPIGKYIEKFIQEQNSKDDTLEVSSLREKNLLKMVKKTEGLEIAEEITDMYKESAKDAIKQTPIGEKPKDG